MSTATRPKPQTGKPEAGKPEGAKEAKPKKVKVKYPNVPQGGFKSVGEIPADFTISKFKKLTRAEFANEAIYFEYMAEQHEKKAARFRAEANDAKLLGGGKSAAKAKKMLKVARELEELKSELAADKDVDVEKLLDSLG